MIMDETSLHAVLMDFAILVANTFSGLSVPEHSKEIGGAIGNSDNSVGSYDLDEDKVIPVMIMQLYSMVSLLDLWNLLTNLQM